MNKHNTQKYGFSLAEALIALVVISLITIASLPVITKKKRDLRTVPHGEWTCEIDSVTGHHVSWSQDSPTPVDGGNKCVFMPPQRAQSFVIKAVGGGGGGGAGFSEKKLSAYVAGQDTIYEFLQNGYYSIGLVGGGGGGGGGNDERGGTRGYGGGAGGSVSFNYIPPSTINYRINIGGGGAGGEGDDGKHSGGNGGNGGNTSIGALMVAYGGNGGEAVRYDRGPRGCEPVCILPGFCIQADDNMGCGSGYANTDTSGSFKALDTKGCIGPNGTQNVTPPSNNYYSSVLGSGLLTNITGNSSFSPYYHYGRGGRGGQGKNGWGLNGNTGYAVISSNIVTAGSGGKASTPKTLPVAQLNGKLEITLGTGGAGGINKYVSNVHTQTAPQAGTSTKVGDLLTATGGEAGKNREIYPTSAPTGTVHLAGKDGYPSSFEPNQIISAGGRKNGAWDTNSNAKYSSSAGGGGGGGGAKTDIGSGNDTAGIYSGNGASGGPGKVIITW